MSWGGALGGQAGELRLEMGALRVLSGFSLPVTSQGKSVGRRAPLGAQDPGVLASVTPWVRRRYRLPLLKDGKLRLGELPFSEITQAVSGCREALGHSRRLKKCSLESHGTSGQLGTWREFPAQQLRPLIWTL